MPLLACPAVLVGGEAAHGNGDYWTSQQRRAAESRTGAPHPDPLPEGEGDQRRRGQSLVEFALVAMVVTMLMGAILTFGQMLFCDQTLQQAADIAARELSRTPLPPSCSLHAVLYGWSDGSDDTLAATPSGAATLQLYQNARHNVFDERYFVLTIDNPASPAPPTGGTYAGMTFNGGHPIGDFPLVIQQLMPIMIYDQIVPWGSSGGTNGTGGIAVLRYPGAVFTDPNPETLNPPASGYLVRIPNVASPQYPGAPAMDTVSFDDTNDNDKALQEIVPSGTSTTTPMDLASAQRGVVALRINYPCQSATMSGYQTVPDPTQQPTVYPVVPISAGYSAGGGGGGPEPSGVGGGMESTWEFGPYAGEYGLGRQAAWAKLANNVRPYRRVLSAQAIYRREVFLE